MTADEKEKLLHQIRTFVSEHPDELNRVLSAVFYGVQVALAEKDKVASTSNIAFLSALALRKYPRSKATISPNIEAGLTQIARNAARPDGCPIEREFLQETKA